ncbi:MAG: hypothetical protein IPP33_09730 [Flavobacteriales bacterium]|nr:hypothetical protein [Flavobacteriales bacterium]
MLGTFVLSSGYYDAYYAQGVRVRRLIRENTLKAFDTYDLVMTPDLPKYRLLLVMARSVTL